MGRFLGERIPDYNPFWEEPEHQENQPDWWKWYHLGHDDGYAYAEVYQTSLEVDKLRSKVEALEALIAANFRVNKDLVLDDTQNKTPDEQS